MLQEDSTGLTVVSTPLDFESFFESQHVSLFQALVLVTGNRHDAEDIVQEAFVRIWERWDSVAPLDNPAAYLHRTAFNIFLQIRRRLMRRLTVGLVSDPVHPADPYAGVESRDVLLDALLGLPRRQRAALILVEFLGYDPKTASQVLSIQQGTVRTHVSRAKASLRQRIEHEWRDLDEP